MRRALSIVFALACAVAGAAAGRAVVRWREDTEAGREPNIELASLRPTPREVIPGVVAALRVHDQPWSYLHIPSWLAAFTVNAAVGSLSKELGPILGMFGVETADEDEDAAPRRADTDAARAAGIMTSEVWLADRLPSTPPIPPMPPASPQQSSGFRPFNR